MDSSAGCLSSDENCVYYGLQGCVFVTVDDLRITGRNRLSVTSTSPYICNGMDINNYGKKGWKTNLVSSITQDDLVQ